MPSHIQTPVMSEFAKIWPVPTMAVWCEELSTSRRNLGWTTECLQQVDEVVLPRKNYQRKIEELIAERRQAVHIFSGLHAYPPIISAYQTAVRLEASRLALMVESGVLWGFKGWMRPLRARLLARYYTPHVRLVLAMGQAGVEFYRRAGFNEETIYPFLYQSPMSSAVSPESVNAPVRMIYIGQFTRRKGVDVLLKAVSGLAPRNWSLTLVGDGPEVARLKYSVSPDIQSRLQWHGVVPCNEVPTLLRAHDICVVPSRFDGWGVVTNEAICAGIPVVCSDRAASNELVTYSGAGDLFRAGNAASMRDALQVLLDDPQRIIQAKRRATQFRSRLEPVRIAQYLSDLLRHCFCGEPKKPQAPWVTS